MQKEIKKKARRRPATAAHYVLHRPFDAEAIAPLKFPSNPVHNRAAGGPLFRRENMVIKSDLTQNLTINHVQVLDALAELGFQLFYCPTCEYADFYVLVRRAGGLPTGGFDD